MEPNNPTAHILHLEQPTTTSRGARQNLSRCQASWTLTGADGNYVLLQSKCVRPNAKGANGINIMEMETINVANQPETTTYTVDIGGDTPSKYPSTVCLGRKLHWTAYNQSSGRRSDPTLKVTETSLSPKKLRNKIWDFSESTGALLWACSPFNNDFILQSMSQGTIANGMLYVGGYDGYMHAINCIDRSTDLGYTQCDGRARNAATLLPNERRYCCRRQGLLDHA